MDSLPVDEALPRLKEALTAGNAAVLVAPPGAGKTTRVPLALREAPWLHGARVLMLEPRRLGGLEALGQGGKKLLEIALRGDGMDDGNHGRNYTFRAVVPH